MSKPTNPSTERVTVRTFDAAEFLDSSVSLAAFLDDAMSLGDPVVLQHALATAARARGVAAVAKEAGLGRESLYKALRPDATPQFWTVVKIIRALGLGLAVITPGEASTGATRRARRARPSHT